MDWYSRYVLSWRLSNAMDVSFCTEALEEALCYGRPEIFNTDKGGQDQGAYASFIDKIEGIARTQGLT
jgi:transposase InsO family protein